MARYLAIAALLLLLTHMAVDVLAPAIPFRQTGLSFQHAQTYGETGVPYRTNDNHLFGPEGVAVDAAGNLWVSEANGGNRVLKFAPDGTLLMSIGEAGEFQPDENHFAGPSDVFVDGSGNIWVADRSGPRVVQYDASGTYQTQIGITAETGADHERFSLAVGVAVDSGGNVYVSDEFNSRVQKFDRNGIYVATLGITGLPGTGEERFQSPYRLAVDADDALYVADMSNHRVQIFDKNLALIGSLGLAGEPGQDNRHFNSPRSVAVDAANIYVADTENNRVQIFQRGSLAYLATLRSGKFGQLELPGDVAVDSVGNLFVVEMNKHCVQMFDNRLNYVRTFGTPGSPYFLDGEHFNWPMSVAVDAKGNIGLVEESGDRFLMLDPSGRLLFTIGQAGAIGGGNHQFLNPWGVAFDASGRIYIADTSNHRIQIFNKEGQYVATLGSGSGNGPNQFNYPRRVEVDRDGNIYVADTFNNRVQIFDKYFAYTGTLGNVQGEPGSADGYFHEAQDVKVDRDGNIFVVDTVNHRVQKFNRRYQLVMTLGVSGERGEDSTHFYVPSGVSVDGMGNIYVADTGNHRIQVFDAAGAYLETIGGTPDDPLNLPYGVEVDAQGNVFVADTGNSRILKFVPVPAAAQIAPEYALNYGLAITAILPGLPHPGQTGYGRLARALPFLWPLVNVAQQYPYESIQS